MSLTPERLGTAAVEAPLAPASSSPLSGGCGLQGKGLGMDCEASGSPWKQGISARRESGARWQRC